MTGMYRRVGVETSVNTASPHQLIKLLLDGFFDSIAAARGAIRANDVELKAKAFKRAIGIVNEGLKGGLDMQVGGDLASNLSNLYAYVSLRLTQANLHNDETILDECVKLMTPVREAWIAIADQADPTPVRCGLEIRA